MLNRTEAMQLLRTHNAEGSLINHALESEAVLRALAERLDANVDLWGLTGLLHDLDYSLTKDDHARHGVESVALLDDGLPKAALQAIQRHAYEMNNVEPPQTDLDFALRCGETVTGLVHAAALVRPTKIEGMKVKSLKKKMKDKAFAASVNRDCIRECDKIGLELAEFLQLSLVAIAKVAPKVGLTDA